MQKKMEAKEILTHVDHTLLTQTATWEEIRQILDDAMKYDTASACIPASYVKAAAEYVDGKLPICTVIGFPNGYSTMAAKVFETKDAIANGASEIDMVINIGHLKDGKYEEIEDEIHRIHETCNGRILKVIIENCLLTEEEKITTLKLKDSLQYVPYDNDMAYCLAYSEQHRPELKQAEYGVDAAEAALVVARSGHMPKVYASASNSWASESWPGDDNEEWQGGVTASMNIFDSGVTWSKIHAAQEALVQAKESQRQIKDNVELEVRTDYLSMREAEKRITTAQVAVASAEEDYHIAVVRYQAGVGTNIDVMDAQEALTQAKTNYYQALYNYNTSKAALNTSMGVGVPVPEPRTFPEPVEDTAAQAADAQSAGTDTAALTENAASDSAQAPANTADAEQPAAENSASTSTAAENGNTAAAEQTAE